MPSDNEYTPAALRQHGWVPLAVLPVQSSTIETGPEKTPRQPRRSEMGDGNGAWTAPQPVPGVIEAVHFLPAPDGGFFDTTPENSPGGYREEDVDIRTGPDDDFVVTGIADGEWLAYRLNVAETGRYDVTFRVASSVGTGRIVLRDGGKPLTEGIAVPSTGGPDAWRTVTVRNVQLAAGLRTLTVEFARGGFDLSRLKITKSAAVTPFTNAFGTNASGWTRFDGTWEVEGGTYYVDASGGLFGKVARGDVGWGDYAIEADIIRRSTTGDAGILVRVNNPADGTAYNVNSPDYLQGYHAFVNNAGVHLWKFNFGWTSLASSAGAVPANAWHRMKVVVSGSHLRVFLGDMTAPASTSRIRRRTLSFRARSDCGPSIPPPRSTMSCSSPTRHPPPSQRRNPSPSQRLRGPHLRLWPCR